MSETLSLHERLFAFRENFVVAASAGTGKTHTLVGVVVHMLLGASELGGSGLHAPIDPARIVATTFSRKAAAEIRERLATSLERIAVRDETAPYRGELASALARNQVTISEAELARRARAALDRLSGAQIGTLHGFAQRLVRDHALERGLSPGFELLSEDDAAAQVEEAIEQALARYAEEEPEGARAVVRASGGVDRLVSDLARVLDRLAEDGVAAEALVVPTDDAEEIERTLDTLASSLLPLQSHTKHGVVATELIDAWRARDVERLELSLSRALGIRKDDRQPLLADFIDVRDRLPGATNPERARRIHRLYRDRRELMPVAIAARELTVRCQRELERARKRSSTLAFGDMLRVARDLLRDRPDVAREVSSSLDALLVDEFQDTSRVQCELVRLLWDDRPGARTAGELPRSVRRSGLLVVGDRKQSIYGFRGADVAVFAEFCVSLAGWRARENLRITSTTLELPETPVAKFVALRENWRSAPEILAFANAFSQRHFASNGESLYDIAYSPEVEDLITPAAKPRPTVRPRVTWIRPGAAPSSKRIDEAHAIAARIADQVGKPTERGPARAYRDFAVLALTNQMLDTVSFALARIDIPYVVAGRGFFSAREVRDVVAMLAWLVRPHDRLAFATVLRSPWLGASDRALLALSVPRRGLMTPPPADLAVLPRADLFDDAERERLTRAFHVAARLRRNVDRMAPATLLREAARAFRLEEALVVLPRGAQRVGNVQKPFALAERTPSARALLRKLERAIERESQETDAATFSDEDDAVRLLTVHASKGLSFPVVFVTQVGADRPARRPGGVVLDPGASGTGRIITRHVDAHGARVDPPSLRAQKDAVKARDAAERRRLTYVALTRAEDEMFLVGKRKPTASEGYRSCPASTLAEMIGEPNFLVEDVEGMPKKPVALAQAPAPRPLAVLPAAPIASESVVAVTPLVDFHHCPRRFQLVHLLELPEELPVALRVTERGEGDGDDARHGGLSPREEGTLLHSVLERVDPSAFGGARAAEAIDETLDRLGPIDGEARRRVAARTGRFLKSDYAARIAGEGATLHREVPFVLTIPASRPETRVGLRGAIDLAVAWPDGSVHVVDYKRARGPSPEPYAMQLDVYALAIERLLGGSVTRTGIVFLGGSGTSPAEPVFRRGTRHGELETAVAALIERLVRARWSRDFPRAEIATCQRLRCGYVGLCHPKTPLVQLGLFAR